MENPESAPKSELEQKIEKAISFLKENEYMTLTKEETHAWDMTMFKWQLISLGMFAWSFALMLKLFT
jgi:hypothetical protein